MKNIASVVSLLLFLLLSCHDNNKEHMRFLVEKWQGKEIVFPEKPLFTQFVTDSINYQIPKSDYKVIMYIDSKLYNFCIDLKTNQLYGISFKSDPQILVYKL